MKKITFLMSLLLSAGAMTASAQVLDRTGWTATTSGECNDGASGHAAAIIDGNTGTYWHSNYGGGNASGDATQTLPQFFVIDMGSSQTFKSLIYVPRANKDNGTATTFKLYVSDTPFQTVDSEHSASAIVSALGDATFEGSFDYTGTGSQPTMVASSETNMTGRYVMFVITASTGQNPNKFGSCAEFNLAQNSYNYTFHYIMNGTELGTITKTVYDPINDAPQFKDYLVNSSVTKNSDSETDYTVQCTTLFAYTSTFDASTAKWYAIDIHNNQANKLWNSGEDASSIALSTIVKGTSTGLTDAYRWTFVGDPTNGFKLYNKATGKAAVLSSTLSLTDAESADIFKITASTASNKANGFCLYKEEGHYLNDNGAGAVATWTATDEGSTMHVQDADSYTTAYAATFVNYDDSNAPEGAIGANSYLANADNLSAFKTAYAAATATSATVDQVNALKTINDQIATATTTTVEAGKYYRLCNKQNNKWLCVRSTDNAQMTTDANASKLASSVVTFDNAETGRFRMKVEGKTFGKYVRDNAAITLEADNSNSKGSYVVSHVGTDFTFYDMASNNAHSYLHCNNNNGAGNVVGWLADGSTPSHWYVVPATDVEIAMSTVGSNSYATAYLPFPVSEVNGAEAYIGTLSTDKSTLDMTKIESIPANTGVVLEGTADKATLTIGNATAISGTNALTGSNVDVTIASDGQSSYLVLGASDNTIGFYTPSSTVTKLTANKAYINASDVTTTAALKLNFGGNNATGINTIAVDGTNGFNAPVYDLSGRRVATPVKGGVYIQNGKKYIK